MKQQMLKKVFIAIMIVVAVLLLVFLGIEIAVRFFGFKPPALTNSKVVDTKQVEVSVPANEKYQHTVSGKFIYFVTAKHVSVADNSGKLKSDFDIVTSEPVVKYNDKYVAIGDLGGTGIYLFSGAEQKGYISANGPIVDISVNKSGSCAVVTEGDMHKRDVTVYNNKGEEQFVWNSGSLFVLGAAVADNNKNIVISTLDTAGGKMKSVLSFYNISDANPVSTEEYENELLAALELNGNYVYCVGDSKCLIYRTNGEKVSEVSYNGKALLTFKTSESHVVLAFADSSVNDKRYCVSIYDHSGKQTGTYGLDTKIGYIDFIQDTIAIGRERLVNLIDVSGREKALIDPELDVSSVRFLGGTGEVVGFTARGAYIFKVS